MIRVFVYSILLSLSLGACSLVNPHVRPKPLDAGKNELDLCNQALEADLCDALNLANGYRDVYRKAADQHSTFRNSASLVSLGSALVSVYYGLSGRQVFRDRVQRLSVIAAGSYAAGTYLTSAPRQTVYYHAASAMTCAVLASAPVMLPRATQSGIVADLAELQNALVDFSALQPTSQEHLDLLSEARSTAMKGAQLAADMTRSAVMLRARIQLIADEVDRLIVEQEPSMASLYSIAGSLPGIAQNFGSMRIAAAKTLDSASEGIKLGASDEPDAAKMLRDQAHHLRLKTAQVALHLANAEMARQDFSEVAACHATAPASEFMVEPADAAVSLTVGKEFTFQVTDARGFPSARLTGKNTDQVELLPIRVEAKSYAVVVKGKAATGVNGPSLLISDTTGAKVVSISLTVASVKPEAEKPASSASSPSALKSRNSNIEPAFLRDPLKILSVQCLTGAKPDCKMGPQTRTAIATFKAAKADWTHDDAIDDKLQTEANQIVLDADACAVVPVGCPKEPSP
jgi:hypothetical protein